MHRLEQEMATAEKQLLLVLLQNLATLQSVPKEAWNTFCDEHFESCVSALQSLRIEQYSHSEYCTTPGAAAAHSVLNSKPLGQVVLASPTIISLLKGPPGPRRNGLWGRLKVQSDLGAWVGPVMVGVFTLIVTGDYVLIKDWMAPDSIYMACSIGLVVWWLRQLLRIFLS